MRISATILLLACATSSTFALNNIVVKGTKFFDSVTKEQFFIKGYNTEFATIRRP
jgi:hypothetical protein